MAQAAGPMPKMLDTGVPNLDLVLGGGLQQHNSYLVVGPSGAGKSVLSQQIAFHRARQGDRVLFITGLDEPHQNLLSHMRTFSFVDFRLVGPQIETISMVPFLDQPVPDKINVLRRTVLNARPQLVTLDGLASLEAFIGGEKGIYQFLYGLTSWFVVEGITLLITRDADPGEVGPRPEFSLMDGVMFLRHDLVGRRSLRRLWVWKMRGQEPLSGLHAFTIDENGISVWPRAEAVFHPADRPWGEARLTFGVPTLDPMLGGGLPQGTGTLVAGDPGTGKTLLALAFLTNGVQQGQPGLWLGFRETRTRLLGMARQWGRDLAEAEAQGRARILTLAPFEQEPDRLAATLRDQVADLKAQRVVLDAADMLERAFPHPADAESFMSWLWQYLPQQGVTTLITRQVPRLPGQEFDASGVPGAALAENVILTRQVRVQSELHRAIAVAKMALPGYESTIREFTLDQYGITLGDPLPTATAEGLRAPRASPEPVRGPV